MDRYDNNGIDLMDDVGVETNNKVKDLEYGRLSTYVKTKFREGCVIVIYIHASECHR